MNIKDELKILAEGEEECNETGEIKDVISKKASPKPKAKPKKKKK